MSAKKVQPEKYFFFPLESQFYPEKEMTFLVIRQSRSIFVSWIKIKGKIQTKR